MASERQVYAMCGHFLKTVSFKKFQGSQVPKAGELEFLQVASLKPPICALDHLLAGSLVTLFHAHP